MNVKIQGGGGGAYANTGSCIGVTNYLAHEDVQQIKDGQEQEQFFTHNKDKVSDREVVYKIDNNRAKLSKTDSKFFVVTVSPSKDEIKAMGKTREEQTANFKQYINEGIMNRYAENFGKDLKNKDLVYYAKIHYSRDDKQGEQMHAHIIVSRKDATNTKKLSPQTNHRGSSKGAVKSGFNRDEFYRKSEHTFDRGFNYDRDFKNSYDYQNTVKNGKLSDIKKLDKMEQEHIQRIDRNKELHTQMNQERQRQEQKLLMTKKKLPVRFTGQHFTIDKVLIKDAIRQANISNQDTVLDIGAGKGFLTVHLLKIANNVVAIENDTALVEHLRKLFSDARNVQVVGCDFRNFAVPKFPFKVVSNIPYGITSDIFKILMFESLGNFLGGSIVLQLEPTQKLFSRKLYNPYTVFYHTFFDLKLVYEVGPESFLPPPTVKSALLNIKRKHLFFDFKFKAKYLAFISCLLEKPDLSVKTALKSIFRKSQVRSISEKFGLNLNAQIVCLSPSQWVNCFLEMLEVVPEKFHPS